MSMGMARRCVARYHRPMGAASGLRKISRTTWVIIALLLLAAAGFGLWRLVLARQPVAVLDWADRQFGGNDGYRIALADGHYGNATGQRVEVIVPDAGRTAPYPVLVFIHGGGWHAGDPRDYRFVGRQFARAGYVVVLAGYRLGPEGRFPLMLQDSAAAVAWTRENIARWSGDPERVFLMGQSAGAYNAVMLALERQWLGREGVPEGFVKGVIGLSGPYDFHPWTSDSARNAFGHVADPQVTQPIHFARSDAPPILLVTGDADETVRPRNSQALAAAQQAVNRPVELLILPGMDHSDTVMKLAAPFNRDRRLLDPVLAFLAAHGGASATVQTRRP